MEAKDLAKYIDHTLLKPDATREGIKTLCNEAKAYGFASVCVNPVWIGLAAEVLSGTAVAPCCVVGFPLGAGTSAAKAFETSEAVKSGAKEIDMVIPIGAAKEGDWDAVERDIAAVKSAAGDALVKVILETCLLDENEKVQACLAAKRAGADFVKTSTGFAGGGATAEDVRLMRNTVGSAMGVKASGGIRTRSDAVKMIEAGASRIGTSAGVAIVGD